ncbi:putative long-chain-fatty-acid--CoA ligase [Hyaloraphidium curvatum]|nr:putative long-chain-fatty-acid--CoA ligase [Hyaloraphidium curvatum]
MSSDAPSPLARLRGVLSQLLPARAPAPRPANRITRASISSYAVPTRGALRRATIGDMLRRHARHRGDSEALVYLRGGERHAVTYKELNDKANRLASAWRALGLQQGDVVAVMSRNSVEYIVAYCAALKSGLVLTSINITFPAAGREITHQLTHARPSLVVAEPLFAPRIAETFAKNPAELAFVRHLVLSDLVGPEAAPPAGWASMRALVASGSPSEEPWESLDAEEDDPILLLYTSGTESLPKGVLVSHRNFLASTTPAWNSALGIMPTDRWLMVMPAFTTAGIGTTTTLLILGAAVVFAETIDAGSALEILAGEGITVMAQTPTFYLAAAGHPRFGELGDRIRLRKCMTYGGTVPKSMIDAWAGKGGEGGIVWGTYWGLSEATQLGSVGWFRTLDDIPNGDLGWIGKPVPQLECRVVDEAGNDVPLGEEGELVVRSPSVMLGYFNDPEKTAATTKGGWLWTGDIVRMDAQSNLFFADRRKDLIKTGGHNVSSVEVERAMYRHPDVLECAVVGLPDDKWSEAVTAFVVLKPGAEARKAEMEAGLPAFARDSGDLAPYKVPKRVEVVPALPKDSQGKILKRELRRIYGAK